MPRLFLCDPSLTSYSGHCFEYLASLVGPAQARGYTPVILGHRAVNERLRSEHGVRGLFSHWCDERRATADATRISHENALREELDEAARDFNIGARDVVLLNTLRHWPLRGVADWLEGVPAERRPHVVVILHFTAFPNPLKPDDTVELYREAFERLAASPAAKHIHLYADTEELVAEYRSIYPIRVDWVPIPHVHGAGSNRKERAPGAPIRVGYLGEARTNKGFHLLPRLAARLEEANLRHVQLHIHSFTHNPAADFYRRAKAGLVRRPGVTLYPHVFDAQEYASFLNSLDIVLIPYTTENYHSQTSGIYAEAVAIGAGTVVPKGTWMARQLGRFGGGRAFNPGDAEDFCATVIDTCQMYPSLSRKAAERANEWHAVHNAEAFLDRVNVRAA